MIPGTTEKGIPALHRVSSSSPPRLKINGIAAFRRSTRRPFCAFPQQDLVNLILRYAVVARPLADEYPVGVAANQIHNIV